MFRYLLSRRRARGGRERAYRFDNNRVTGSARALALVVLLVSAPGAWALGLGDIELDSALNEKLDAEIELINAQGLQPTEVIVSLASAEDFERVGVERFFFLTDLRFEVDFDSQGVRNVKVTSVQPVTEPYLNFLVEVLWPNGRLLKEYTLLLDPPTFSPAPAPTVSAPAQARQDSSGAGRIERPTSATTSRGTNVQLAPGRQTQRSPLDEGVVDGEYRMTDRTDTLWTIAARTRASQAVTVQQNMLAIQRLNPEAFLNGNINLLKAGYTLRLPTEQQALATGSGDANQQVALQNEDWRALQRGEPLPSRGEQQVAAAGERAEPTLQAQVDATPAEQRPQQAAARTDGELRIVAGSADGQAGAGPVGAEQLDAALEEQDRLGLEVEALTEELDREREIAGNQIAVKDRQLEVKDQQIAEMQAEMARLREEMEQLQTAALEQRQNQSASATTWWQSPYVLGGALGVVVLLLVYGLVAARRRRAEDDDFYPEVTTEDALAVNRHEPIVATAAVAADVEEDEALIDDSEIEAPQATGEARRGPAEETAGSETNDVIGEADIYIAYGRYPQAIGLLLGVLEEDPGRNDVRLKLLELYAETRDREAFDVHMAELLERCDDDEALLTARELGGQFGDEPTRPSDNLLDAGEQADLAADDQEVGDLDLTELDDLGAATDAAPGPDEFELELDDLAGEETGGRDSHQTSAALASAALGGDLGIDFDPDRTGNGEASSDTAHAAGHGDAASGDDLDLDLDLDDTSVLGDDAFDFDDEGDTAGTKLDLARAYIDMGDQDGARDILNEVVAEGNSEQQKRAQAMLEELQ